MWELRLFLKFQDVYGTSQGLWKTDGSLVADNTFYGRPKYRMFILTKRLNEIETDIRSG